MKNKIILIIFMVSLMGYFSHAQIYVGGKLGLSPSVFSYQSLPNHKSSPVIFNPLAGVMVEIPIVYGFSIQPEVQYVVKGTNLVAERSGKNAKSVIKTGNYFSDFSEDNLANDHDKYNGFADPTEQFKLPDLYENIKVNIGYIETHLMFKYEFIGGGSGLYIEAGPYYGLGISSKSSSTLINPSGKKSSEEPLVARDASITENYTDLVKSYTDIYQLSSKPFTGEKKDVHVKKSDLGVGVGAGLYKEFGSSRMYFDLRALLGLANINGKANTSSTIKSRAIQLSITYLLPIE